MAQNKVAYEVMPGPQDICVKVVNKGHTPIGPEQCVKASVN